MEQQLNNALVKLSRTARHYDAVDVVSGFTRREILHYIRDIVQDMDAREKIEAKAALRRNGEYVAASMI